MLRHSVHFWFFISAFLPLWEIPMISSQGGIAMRWFDKNFTKLCKSIPSYFIPSPTDDSSNYSSRCNGQSSFLVVMKTFHPHGTQSAHFTPPNFFKIDTARAWNKFAFPSFFIFLGRAFCVGCIGIYIFRNEIISKSTRLDNKLSSIAL